ncbi:MAG: hypothetical protein K9M94_15040 [Spirochaetia bacterium]|nr:hypothetical protein [Spirochaetia bacterium]
MLKKPGNAKGSFPIAIEIIDLFHAKGTISNTAIEIFGSESEYVAQWAKTCRDELEEGKLNSIIGKLEVFAKKFKEAQ